MAAKKHTMLIAGASGVVGAAAVKHLHEWRERMQVECLLPR